MATEPDLGRPVPPVADTLRWVVAGFRVLSWIWILMLIVVVIVNGKPGNRAVLTGIVILATVWTGVTLWAAGKDKRLGSGWFVGADTVIALFFGAAGLLAGTEDFISGGWPNSWLFVVAFATNLRWTMVAAVILLVEHFGLHILHDLDAVRTAGIFQYLVFGLIGGWSFETLRLREALRLDSQARLTSQQNALTRQEERLALARKLHDSYLQTLHSTRAAADNPDQVRYLTRRQERELRRTIEEFRSPFSRSFRAEMLLYRDEVEDLYRDVEIIEVIRDDAEVTRSLAAALSAAREAMVNAARHSGAKLVDLYSEINNGEAVIHVRDRGNGFDILTESRRGISLSLREPVEAVGGEVFIDSTVGLGTEVVIRVPSL